MAAAGKSPIMGPSGPGASPMVSPGTGAGVQAQAMRRLQGVIQTLMEIGGSLGATHPAFNAVASSVKSLSGALNKEQEPPKTPLPVPGTPPGAGLGGAPRPPTGNAPPGGGPGAPVAPAITGPR